MFLTDVCKTLNEYGVHYAIVGGYAVALHGAVRGTVDIDLVIKWEKCQLMKVEASLKSLGLLSKLPIDAETLFTFRDEYINNRNLIAWSFYHPNDASKLIDIIINYDLKERKVIEKQLKSQSIKILNRMDLIKMKQISSRPQDIEDIKALKMIQ